MDNPLIPTVKYATLVTEGDGVKTAWEFNFAGGYISPEHVKAFTENVTTGELVIRSLTLIGANTAQIVPAVASGLRLVIYRDTPKTEPLVDYGTGSILNESSLDKSNKQAVFIAAELADRVIADYDFSNALLYAVTTATSAAAVANGIDWKATAALVAAASAESSAASASDLWVTPERFGAGITATDAEAWAAAMGYCSTSGKHMLLQRMYNISSAIFMAEGVNVSGVGRNRSGLQFSGVGSLTLAGEAGTKNHGNITLSRLLLAHSGDTTGVNMSEFRYVTLDDVMFYHCGLSATRFSYLTFRDCVGFDFTVRLYGEVNTLNEAPKFIGGNFSNLDLRITETTDVMLSSVHNLGPKASISIARGSNPVGLYPIVMLSQVIVDSADGTGISISGCEAKLSQVFSSCGRVLSLPGIYLQDCVEGGIDNSTTRYCGRNGLELDACRGLSISGAFTDNKIAGVQMSNCVGIKFLGADLGNTPGWYGGNYVQQYGIVDATSNSTYTYLAGNRFFGNSVAPVYLPDVTTEYGINLGLVRAVSGTAALSPVDGVATLPHSLGSAPTFAEVSAISGDDVKTQITGVDATNIAIRFSSATTNANITGSFQVFWSAKL